MWSEENLIRSVSSMKLVSERMKVGGKTDDGLVEYAFPTFINDTTSISQGRGRTWTTDRSGGRYGHVSGSGKADGRRRPR
jgi:hypothetical protein